MRSLTNGLVRSLATLLLCLVTTGTALAQTTVITVERWIIRTHPEVDKQLPAGFSHFQSLPSEVRVPIDMTGTPVCFTEAQAISYGKRLGLGNSQDAAIRIMKTAWGGKTVCGHLPANTTLVPMEYSIRGDDKGRPIFLVKLLDGHMNAYFMGSPHRP